MLEAAKRYLTYRKLGRILQGDCSTKVFAVFPPPVLNAHSYLVEIQPVDAKAFFSLPNANIDRIVRDSKGFGEKIGEIGRKYSGIKEKFREMFRELRIGLNAIKLNVPLAFYEILEMKILVEKVEKEIIEYVEEFLKPVRSGDTIERLAIDGVNVANILYSIALYESIRDFKDTLDKPEVKEILKIFSKTYENLGISVNEYFLERDVGEIITNAEKIKEGESEILEILKYGCLRRSGNEPRNFFAHSGFLEEYTIIEKRKGKIYVRWDEKKRKDFKNWLFNPR